MRKTDASNAKNWDISHETAPTSSIMNVINLDTWSWTALTEYPLQEHWHHTTSHIEIATLDHTLDITRETEKEETGPDHSLANIIAPAIMTCTEAAPDYNNGIGTATT